jgi:hypothetical protein
VRDGITYYVLPGGQLAVLDVRPPAIAAALATTPDTDRLLTDWSRRPLVVDEV